MPLLRSKSDKAFEQNVRAEMRAGKPQKQALAIAYAIKRRAQKKSEGGLVKKAPIGETMEKGLMQRLMERRRARKMSEGGMVYPDADYPKELAEHKAEHEMMEEMHKEDETRDFTWPPPERKGSDHPRARRKEILGKVLKSVRSRHMGK
jgi:hypothetical protein